MENNRSSTGLKQITKAPIAKQEFKLKREFIMPTAIAELQNKYGIDNLLTINQSVEDIVKIIIDKLSDGFQLTDGLAAFSLISPLKTVGDKWSEAKKEYSDLVPEETATVTNDLVIRGLNVGGVDLNNVGNRGIDDFIYALGLVADLYDLIDEKLADGYQAEDLEELPEVTEIVLKIFKRLEEVILDIKDISGREYAEAIKYLALRVHTALAKPRLVNV
jgi:hypothetical protein